MHAQFLLWNIQLIDLIFLWKSRFKRFYFRFYGARNCSCFFFSRGLFLLWMFKYNDKQIFPCLEITRYITTILLKHCTLLSYIIGFTHFRQVYWIGMIEKASAFCSTRLCERIRCSAMYSPHKGLVTRKQFSSGDGNRYLLWQQLLYGKISDNCTQVCKSIDVNLGLWCDTECIYCFCYTYLPSLCELHHLPLLLS